MRFMGGNGEFKRSERIDDSRQLMWELRPIANAFYLGGAVDQITLPTVVFFETLSRRSVGIIGGRRHDDDGGGDSHVGDSGGGT